MKIWPTASVRNNKTGTAEWGRINRRLDAVMYQGLEVGQLTKLDLNPGGKSPEK